MENYLIQKYAHVLEAEDIDELFENIVKVYKSKTKAAKKIGVARTTADGWKKANYVKSLTKSKVLRTSLEANLIETLNLLTSKSKITTEDMLLTYLSAIYQKAINSDRADFNRLLDRFLVVRHDNFGLIRDSLKNEIILMKQTLTEKALGFQISVPEDSVQNIDPEQMLELIPDVVTDLVVRRMDPVELANRYNIPVEIPITIMNALTPIISTPERFDVQPVESPWIDINRFKKTAGDDRTFNLGDTIDTRSFEAFDMTPINR